MKQRREKDGQYGHSRKFYTISFLSIVVGVYFLVWFIPKIQTVYGNQTAIASTTQEYIDLTPEKIVKIQDKLLDELSLGCEVKGVNEPDAAILLDTNNQMSIGRFQFQIKTVQYYVNKFESKEINRRDAILIALSPSDSKELARKIIFSQKNGIETNWTNCAVSHQLIKEVETINSFSNI